MHIKQQPVDKLIPYARNARTHSPEQIAQIAASIKEFGFNNPILIDSENVIIAGHGRLEAARMLGMDKVPTIRLDHMNENQKRAYILADNKMALNAGWDDELLKLELQMLQDSEFDLDLTGFDDVEVEGLLFEPTEGLTDEDAVPDAPEEPITQPGDIWLLGNHRVMCGDSTNIEDVEKLMGGKSVDLLFTDPPYGVSYADKNAFLNAADKGNRIQRDIENDHMTLEDTGELWADTFDVWSEKLSDYHSYYICSPAGEPFPVMINTMMGHGFPMKHTIVWVKNNHVLGRTDYNYKHEPILYGWASKHKFFGNGDQKSSVWNYDKPLKNDLHPTMKPVALIENAIKNSTQSNNNLVADPFLGSGSTLIASEKTGRACFGMEIDPIYCDVIVKRWEDFTGNKAVKENKEAA